MQATKKRDNNNKTEACSKHRKHRYLRLRSSPQKPGGSSSRSCLTTQYLCYSYINIYTTSAQRTLVWSTAVHRAVKGVSVWFLTVHVVQWWEGQWCLNRHADVNTSTPCFKLGETLNRVKSNEVRRTEANSQLMYKDIKEGRRRSIEHAGGQKVPVKSVSQQSRGWTYMLPILEEKPGERAVKSLTDEPDVSTSPTASGVSAKGSIGPEKSAGGASGFESELA